MFLSFNFMFCPKCKKLLCYKEGEFVCTICGYKQSEEAKKSNHKIRTKRNIKRTGIIEEEFVTMPKTKATCPKCGNNEAYWIIKQVRSADEPETKFYRCTKCNYTWREE
jgi:DNA-directed RNA polymerase subunit M